jgi:DNA-binding response OmpR family regulator
MTIQPLSPTCPELDTRKNSAFATGYNAHILVVDDDRLMRQLLSRSLQRLGYQVTTVQDGLIALNILDKEQIDLILLDVLMPGMDGFTLCERIRRHSFIPIIMLTALNRPDNIVDGIELGADYYITKPFKLQEVAAKVHAILRRSIHPSNMGDLSDRVTGLEFNHAAHRVVIAGKTIQLTPTEYDLLYLLSNNPNHPISKTELLQKVWKGSSSDDVNLVELAVRRLRQKIEDDPANPMRVVTVRGVGYKFCPLAPSQQRSPRGVGQPSQYQTVAAKHQMSRPWITPSILTDYLRDSI